MKVLPNNWFTYLGGLTLAVLLAVCLPLFLCMPPETDITFYDLCARNILRGGVHYRDAFDTNLPGMVWLHALVRSTLGWRSEALRAADFAVVGAITWLLVRWLRLLNRPAAVQVWTAVALFAFYLSRSEWCHCQRDTWMLLPALIALEQRRRQDAATDRRRTRLGGVSSARRCWRDCAGAGFLDQAVCDRARMALLAGQRRPDPPGNGRHWAGGWRWTRQGSSPGGCWQAQLGSHGS